MKVMLGQINTTPRDFAGNVQKIKEGIEFARLEEADLAVFPELAIGGYGSKDLIYNHKFIEANLRGLQQIIEASKDAPRLAIVLGYVDKNRDGVGKPYRNMAAVISDGVVVANYAKQLLPFYDVFDEGRYFQPGIERCIVEAMGESWGIAICEDLWNDKGSDDYNYWENPLQSYRDVGVRNLISINSSPYVVGKPEKRIEMMCKNTAKEGTIIYVNQIGGQDELIFDGNSFICRNGDLLYLAPSDVPYSCFDLDAESPKNTASQTTEIMETLRTNRVKTTYDLLVLGTRDYIRKNGFKGVVCCSSGGIDSAVVGKIICDAIGPENVHMIRLPTQISSGHSKEDALKLHENLGCRDYIFPVQHLGLLDQLKTCFLGAGSEYNNIADQNIQARLRGLIMMHFSNAYNVLPITTGNKTELALGYCTLGGDMQGGFAPLGDLLKTEVRDLAEFINSEKEIIPQNILVKPPSAELEEGQTDESNLLPYPILDCIVEAYVQDYVDNTRDFGYWLSERVEEENNNATKTYDWLFDENDELVESAARDYKRMITLIDRNEFKRRLAAPCIKVSRVAFGSGRRLPITKG